MAGCDTQNHPGQGDYGWSKKRVTAWFLIGATLGALGTLIGLAMLLSGVALGLVGGLAAFGAVIFAALAVGLLAMFIGYGVEWFTRLKNQDPSEITFHGWVLCAGRNLGNPGPPAFCDGDWTFNIAPHLEGVPVDPARTWTVAAPGGLSVDEVRTRTAPGAEFAGRVFDPDNGNIDILHTEIGSRIGDYAAAGGMIGSAAGLAAGIAVGVAICAALGIATFGIALAVCALIVAIAAAAGTLAGGAIGQWAGGGIGALVDWADDFDEAGEAIQEGCFVALTGTWVTDRSHQHNEIHDIESFQIVDCGTAAASSPLESAAAVGIGRHPTGPDP
jgi:hypothetical protein